MLSVLALLLPIVEVRLKPDLTRAAAQQRLLTVEDIYGHEGATRFNGSFTAGMSWVPSEGPWLSDTHHLWPGPDGVSWMRIDARTGTAQPLATAKQALRKASMPLAQ